MGLKDFLSRKAIERQLKNFPPGQREIFQKLFKDNPELFEKMGNEIKARKKQGQDEMLASVSVMRKYEPEIRALLNKM